jgi:hypothetical protein
MAEKREQDALTKILDLFLKQSLADYRAIFLVEGIEFKEQLHEEFYQPAPFTSSTPSNRTQQIADALAKETERIKMDSRRQFLKAFDAWELSKKNQNDAVPQLRILEQNVKKHTAVESVLEAFRTVSNLQNAITARYPALCPILKESITVPATQE